MKRRIAWLTILGALVFVAPAIANAGNSETITSTLTFPYTELPNTAPYVGTFGGTFSASGTVSDSGAVTAQTLLGAVPSRGMATQQTVRTLAGGNGTLTLRCNERFSPPNQPGTVTGAPVSLAGSCVLLDATGAYAGLRGPGSLTGTTTFGATTITLQDTLTLVEH